LMFDAFPKTKIRKLQTRKAFKLILFLRSR
jgi:hypothetical protein